MCHVFLKTGYEKQFFFKSLSHVQLFAIPWAVADKTLPSTGFSRQEYGSGLPFSFPGEGGDVFLTEGSNLDLPNCRQMFYHLSHQGSPHKLNSLTSWTPFCKVVVIVWPLSCVQLFCDPTDQNLPSSFAHEDSLGKNTGVGCHAQLQGIFPTQGSNPCILNWPTGSLLSEPLK